MHLVQDGQSSVRTILVLFFAMVVLAVAGPLPSVQNPDMRGLTQWQEPPDVSALAPAAIIEKRALWFNNYLVFNTYNIYYSAFNSILPFAAAVTSLMDFYVTIAENAAPGGAWRQFVAPSGHFGTIYGLYELDIYCERQITWNMIYNFAFYMAHQSRRGLVGTYTAHVSFTAEGVDMFIMLRVRQG